MPLSNTKVFMSNESVVKPTPTIKKFVFEETELETLPPLTSNISFISLRLYFVKLPVMTNIVSFS